jgi:EmrB/QacA subfamily drug resistance transporter
MAAGIANEADDKSTKFWVLALASVASLMVALDSLIVSTALTEIGRDFNASIEALEWTVNAYLLSFAVLLMTASAIGDRLGRRRVFAAGLGLFVAASAACALAPDIGWLIAARSVQGVGAAILMPLALTQVSAAFPPERRGWALGIYSGVTALSTVIGPIVGGAVTQGLAWRWIFWLNLPIGLAAVALTFARLRESFGPRARVDLAGIVLVTGAAFGLVWGLVRANAAGWGSAEIIASLAAGAVLAIAFVAWEGRAAAPMMPMRLFHQRAFSASTAAMFLLNGALISAVFFMAQFQQAGLGQDALAAGLRLLPWGIAITLVAPKAGALAARLGERATIVVGLTAQAIGLAWLGAIAWPDLAYPAMIAPMILAGAGFAMAVPLVQKGAFAAVAAEDIGKASGALSMIRQLGGAFGVAVTVALFGHFGGRASPRAFCDGFAAAMGAAALLSFVGAIAALWLNARSAAPAVSPPTLAPTGEIALRPSQSA